MLGASMVMLWGCTSINVESNRFLGSPSFQPTDPATVQILQAEPKRPYVRLGEVLVQPQGKPTYSAIEQRVRVAAAQLGADAVIVEYDGARVAGWNYWGPRWAPSAYVSYERVIVLLAIHYTDG